MQVSRTGTFSTKYRAAEGRWAKRLKKRETASGLNAAAAGVPWQLEREAFKAGFVACARVMKYARRKSPDPNAMPHVQGEAHE